MGKSNQKIKDTLERKIQLLRDSRHTKLYYVAIMDYHEYICSSKELSPILKKIITEDNIPPVYLGEIFNDFIISQHLKYNAPKEPIYPNFYTKEIEDKYKLMGSFAKLIKSEYDASKFPNKINFNPNLPIVKAERDEEFFYTQRLHNDIIEKLDEGYKEQIKEKTKKYKLIFDNENRLLHLKGETILIGKKEESDPHKLLRTLFKDIHKVWANDEILEDWGYDFDEKTPKDKAYKASVAVNKIVAQDTRIKDFLIYSTKTVSINKKYLI